MIWNLFNSQSPCHSCFEFCLSCSFCKASWCPGYHIVMLLFCYVTIIIRGFLPNSNLSSREDRECSFILSVTTQDIKYLNVFQGHVTEWMNQWAFLSILSYSRFASYHMKGLWLTFTVDEHREIPSIWFPMLGVSSHLFWSGAMLNNYSYIWSFLQVCILTKSRHLQAWLG